MIIVGLTIVIPIIALCISITIQQLTIENNNSTIIYWGDKLCIISICATISLSYVLFSKFISLGITDSKPSIVFLIYLIPFLLLMVHFFCLVRSVLNHFRRDKTGRANFIGVVSLSIHLFVCFANEFIFRIV